MEETIKHPNPQAEEEVISLDSLWHAVKKRFWVMILAAVICTVAYYLVATVTFKPVYTTSSTFTVAIGNYYGNSTKTYNNKTAQQMAKTFPYVLQSGVLGDIVAADLGYTSMPGTVVATAIEDTNLFTLQASAADPQLAYDILQSVVRNYPQVAEYVVGTTTLTLLDEDGVVTAAANAVTWKTSLKWGGLLGLAIGLLFIVVYMLLHKTVQNTDDLKRLTNARCLAVVPHLSDKKRSQASSGTLITQKRVPQAFVESIYRLRSGVERADKKVLLVTSSLPDEGKTMVAANLALALAKKGKRVILVDVDLRNPSLAKQLGVPSRLTKVGLSDYLNERVEMDGLGFTVSNLNNLVVIPAGCPTKNASELLNRGKLRTLIAAMRDQADFVILDTPPSAVLADSSVVARWVDGVVYVVRQDYASCDRVLSGMDNIASAGAPMVGCVINDASLGLGRYGYGYGYIYRHYSYYDERSAGRSGKEG